MPVPNKPTETRSPAASHAPSASAPTTALDRVAIGGTIRIAAVHGDEPLRRRLLEMGLVPGTLVTILRRAPLGDPIELSAHGYLLSLRVAEARHVFGEA